MSKPWPLLVRLENGSERQPLSAIWGGVTANWGACPKLLIIPGKLPLPAKSEIGLRREPPSPNSVGIMVGRGSSPRH